MDYGLTSTGFNKKPFDVILTDFKEQINNEIGPLILDEEDIITVLLSIEAASLADVYQAMEAVINSYYRATATQSSLDGVSSNIGLTRLGATPTIVNAVVTGDNMTLIDAGSEATAVGVNTVFVLSKDVVIDNQAARLVSIKVRTDNEISYSLNLDSNILTYTKEEDDTIDDIIDGLVDVINTADLNVGAAKSGSNLIIQADQYGQTFSVFVDEQLAIEQVSVYAIFIASDKGKISLPARSLTTIQTPISGWISIDNPIPGVTGRNTETDVEFRARGDISLSLAGSATPAAIRARVLNVPGVTAATVDNNETLTTNSQGTPAKSFQVLVVGGDDEDIAKAIYAAKSAGISAFGNTFVTVENEDITPILIGFSRPVNVYIYVSITYSVDNTNTFPVNGEEQIASNVAKKINSLDIGQDVILQALYCSIYDVRGIQEASILLASSLDPDDAGVVYGNNNITISSSQIAVTDATKILVGAL